MDTPALAQFIAEAPRTPGVYTWRDARGTPLYIGKASNLKARLSSYRKTTDSRIATMIERADTITWQELATDIEALILESQLIKRWHPRFNIMMRDDKQYFYVVTTKEDFPKFIATHQPETPDAIGPFTEGAPLKATLRTLRRLYPYCTCKQTHHLRCLNAHIGMCPGYCCLKTSATRTQKAEYRRNIRAIRDLLTGKKLLKKLAQYPYIQRVFQNARIVSHLQYPGDQLQKAFGLADIPHRIEGYDIANIQGQHATGSMIVFTDGSADRNEYRKFTIKTVIGANDTAMLREVLTRRMNHAEWPLPDLIIVDGGKGQLNAARAIIKTIPILALTKNDKHQGDHLFSSLSSEVSYLTDLPQPVANLILHVDSEAHRFAIAHYRRRHGRSLTNTKK